MDFSDAATMHEEMMREIALKACLHKPQRDYAAELCPGCQFATKTNYGRACDGWKDCLQDLQKRERKLCRA